MNTLTGKPSPDPACGRHNIPNVAIALEALQSLVEFHGGHTDAAALQVIREALAMSHSLPAHIAKGTNA